MALSQELDNLDCLLSHKVNMFQVNEEKVLQLFISIFTLVATGEKGGKRLKEAVPQSCGLCEGGMIWGRPPFWRAEGFPCETSPFFS